MKSRISLHIDRPTDGSVLTPIFVLEGWFTWTGQPISPILRLNGAEITWTAVPRPDVQAAFPGREALGFRALVDLGGRYSGGDMELTFTEGGVPLGTTHLRCGNDLAASCERSGRARSEKRSWLKDHLVCPNCGEGGRLDAGESGFECRTCSGSFPERDGAIDFLSTDIIRTFRIDASEDISAHPYDEVAQRLVQNVRARNGKVLDCGSGLRPYIDDAVVCVEIAPYPNVDVLAVNQRLPFRTASFDGALSLNVLEHVTDPFRSAAELMRVLKPGAMLYCCIPFLQPEHGYPHHYFNATRSGLRELFAGKAQVLEHFVPRSGEPIWTLHWFLSWYAERLPAAEKKKFLDLKMADILSGPPEALLEMPWVRGLSDDGRWRLASTTAAILQKL